MPFVQFPPSDPFVGQKLGAFRPPSEGTSMPTELVTIAAGFVTLSSIIGVVVVKIVLVLVCRSVFVPLTTVASTTTVVEIALVIGGPGILLVP